MAAMLGTVKLSSETQRHRQQTELVQCISASSGHTTSLAHFKRGKYTLWLGLSLDMWYTSTWWTTRCLKFTHHKYAWSNTEIAQFWRSLHGCWAGSVTLLTCTELIFVLNSHEYCYYYYLYLVFLSSKLPTTLSCPLQCNHENLRKQVL